MKRLINIFCFLAIIAAVSAAVPNYYQLMTDYCQIECPPGAKHVGCDSSKIDTDERKVRNVTILSLTDNLKNYLTKLHNEKRNIIAGGLEAGFPPACRMSPMRWNNELAALAALNIERYGGEPDECRNTVPFQNAGQNVYELPDTNGEKAVEMALNDWYSQKKNCKGCILQNYRVSESRERITDFMTLVLEDNTQFGCAIGSFIKNGDDLEHALVCNYATSIKDNEPVYKECKSPAEKCKKRHPDFKNLCSFKEGARDVLA